MKEFNEESLLLFLNYWYTGKISPEWKGRKINELLILSEMFGNYQFTGELIRKLQPREANFENALSILLNPNSSPNLIEQAKILPGCFNIIIIIKFIIV